ncbi:hypothetical protein CLF_110406 [Clonorchis sinensis]|uniref:Uncharacterized protein n=1 Tax=Clonorchis sinensis TaxID=79923 RepID=G7YKN4_CLOSI|nr:hypothetical protein CLF_110406 [Clonorchis sinensis]
MLAHYFLLQFPQPTKASVKKSPVTKPTVSTKTEPKVPFKIFEDPVSANCQHCGSERRKPSLPIRERVSTTSVGVQACDTDIREWLCTGISCDLFSSSFCRKAHRRLLGRASRTTTRGFKRDTRREPRGRSHFTSSAFTHILVMHSG